MRASLNKSQINETYHIVSYAKTDFLREVKYAGKDWGELDWESVL
jgi:hypothetical protein